MVVVGRVVFPNGAAAVRGIQELPSKIARIELRWGDSMRVDLIVNTLGLASRAYSRELLEWWILSSLGRCATIQDKMEPIIDHIQITVKDMTTAVPFYDKLLPLLGFDIRNRVTAAIEEHEFRVVEYTHPRLIFAITSPRSACAGDRINRRKPGALHHLAFKAESRAEVDRLHGELDAIGATIVSPPREYPEYTPPGYYALFFKDLDGIKYEIVCTTQDRA